MSAQTRKERGRGDGVRVLEGDIWGGLVCASHQFSGTKLRYFRLLGMSLPWGLPVPQGMARTPRHNPLSISRKLGTATPSNKTGSSGYQEAQWYSP